MNTKQLPIMPKHVDDAGSLWVLHYPAWYIDLKSVLAAEKRMQKKDKQHNIETRAFKLDDKMAKAVRAEYALCFKINRTKTVR